MPRSLEPINIMRWLSGDYVMLPSRDPLKIRRLSDDYHLIMWTTLEAESFLWPVVERGSQSRAIQNLRRALAGVAQWTECRPVN